VVGGGQGRRGAGERGSRDAPPRVFSPLRPCPPAPLPLFDYLPQPGVRAGGVVGRVGQGQDGLVRADGEALDGPEGGVLQLPAQQFGEVGAAGVVVGERLAQAGDRGGGPIVWARSEESRLVGSISHKRGSSLAVVMWLSSFSRVPNAKLP